MKSKFFKSVLVVAHLFWGGVIYATEIKSSNCEYWECVACDEGAFEYLTRMASEHGDQEDVISELTRIAMGKVQNHFSSTFYKEYGPYIMLNITDEDEAGLIYKLLLESGVNPYASIDGEFTIAELSIIGTGLEAFKALVSYGKLEKCPNTLRGMITHARNVNKVNKAELLEKLLKTRLDSLRIKPF